MAAWLAWSVRLVVDVMGRTGWAAHLRPRRAAPGWRAGRCAPIVVVAGRLTRWPRAGRLPPPDRYATIRRGGPDRQSGWGRGGRTASSILGRAWRLRLVELTRQTIAQGSLIDHREQCWSARGAHPGVWRGGGRDRRWHLPCRPLGVVRPGVRPPSQPGHRASHEPGAADQLRDQIPDPRLHRSNVTTS
jgi:hypothetical protein